MDWLFIVLVAVFIILIILVLIVLALLLKQGDERFEYIKAKAITNSFIATVGLLVAKLCYGIYKSGVQTTNENRVNLSLLITISIIFLFSLLWEKRKYGG